MNKLKVILTNFFRQATGIAPEIIAGTTRKARAQVTFLGVLMTVIPTLVGTLIGLSVWLVTSSVLLGLGIGLLVILTTYLTDRVVTDSRLEGNSWLGKLLRPFALAFTVCLAVMFMEPAFLHKQVYQVADNQFRAQQRADTAAINQDVIQDRKAMAKLDAEYKVLADKREVVLDIAVKELAGEGATGVPGPGDVYLASVSNYFKFQEIFQSDSSRIAAQAQQHLNRIERAEVEVQVVLDKGFQFSKVSLGEQLNIIAGMVQEEKRRDVILILLTILGFSVLMELLPLTYRGLFMDYDAILKSARELAATSDAKHQVEQEEVRFGLEAGRRLEFDRMERSIDSSIQQETTTTAVDNKMHELEEANREFSNLGEQVLKLGKNYNYYGEQADATYRETLEFAHAVALEKMHEVIDKDFSSDATETTQPTQ